MSTDSIDPPPTPSGIYYIVIDGFGGDTNTYTLNITPEPTTLALFGLGAAFASYRARRKRPVASC